MASNTNSENNEQFDSFPSSNVEMVSTTKCSSTILSNKKNISYGVDWSVNASSSSHCWFPLSNNDSCPEEKSTDVQCGICGLIVDSNHFNDLKVSSCRPSFIESEENSLKYDEHYWSNVFVFSSQCEYCKSPSINKNLFDRGLNSLKMSNPLEFVDQMTSMIDSLSNRFNAKMSTSTDGVVCLWCSTSYHQSCWEKLSDDNKNNRCDYGIFREIIVRPQWLIRSNECSIGFKAQVSSNSSNNDLSYTPVIAFINKRSGGQIGEKISRELIRRLNPRQIFVLENNQTIIDALSMYSSLPNVRICVFGGDGTVGWVLACLAEVYPCGNNPPVSICPLGTGNDLSRVLSWGEQYDPQRLIQTLLQIPSARTVLLDRWKIEIDTSSVVSSTTSFGQNESGIDRIFQLLFNDPKLTREINRLSYENYQKLPNTRFINYMSFGLDAAVALEFHHQRILNPDKFSSPLKNKLMYLNESCKYFNDFARANIWDLTSYIRLTCDGQNLTNSLKNCHSLIVLNIPGYAAGTNPWGNSSKGPINLFEYLSNNETSFHQQDFGDKKIEVVGLSTTHMAAIHMGFSGYRIAQCRQLRLELSSPITAQIDGEPFYLPTSIAINIDHAGQVRVSENENNS